MRVFLADSFSTIRRRKRRKSVMNISLDAGKVPLRRKSLKNFFVPAPPSRRQVLWCAHVLGGRLISIASLPKKNFRKNNCIQQCRHTVRVRNNIRSFANGTPSSSFNFREIDAPSLSEVGA